MSLNRWSSQSERARPFRRARRHILPVLALAALAGTLAFRNAASTAEGTAGASIFYSGEQRGYLEPCGCSKPQIGGLARRATFLKRLPPEVSHLQIDNGDLIHTVGRQSELKAEALAEFFKETRYAAVNLGEKDFMLGFGYLRYLQSIAQVPLLSGNVVRTGGKPVFESYVVRSVKVDGEETPIAIVGMISPAFETEIAQWNPGFSVLPPAEALAALKPRIEAEAKRVVLLYHGGPEEARVIAAAHPWIQAIITAHEAEDYRARAVQAGGAILVNAGQKGKYLGKLDLQRDAEGKVTIEHRFPVEMSHEIPDDPEVRGILNRYLAHVGDEDLLSKLPKRKTPNGQEFAGTKACLTCHPAPHKTWEDSAHAKAWETLVKVKHDRDPDCVGCHVVGLEYEGGFKSIEKTPHLVDVGCESCHGAQGSHAKNPLEFKPPKVGANSCASCHVPEHSPNFDFESYWKKIEH